MTTTTHRPAPVSTQTFWCALDNYEPIARKHFRGTLVEYPIPNDPERTQYAIQGPNPFYEECENGPNPVFLLDDGNRIVSCYVSGYQPKTGEVFIEPLPVNPEKRTRPDGRIIDFSTWKLGPRKAYHLKLHD